MQKRPIWAVWPGTEKSPHIGTQEAMKTPPIQLDHLHVFGLESASTQSEKGGGGVPATPFSVSPHTPSSQDLCAVIVALPASPPLDRPPSRPSCSGGGDTAESAAALCPCPFCSMGVPREAPRLAGALELRGPTAFPLPPKSIVTTGGQSPRLPSPHANGATRGPTDPELHGYVPPLAWTE